MNTLERLKCFLFVFSFCLFFFSKSWQYRNQLKERITKWGCPPEETCYKDLLLYWESGRERESFPQNEFTMWSSCHHGKEGPPPAMADQCFSLLEWASRPMHTEGCCFASALCSWTPGVCRQHAGPLSRNWEMQEAPSCSCALNSYQNPPLGESQLSVEPWKDSYRHRAPARKNSVKSGCWARRQWAGST